MPYIHGADNTESVELNDLYRQFMLSEPRPRAVSVGALEQNLSKAQNFHTMLKKIVTGSIYYRTAKLT